MNSRTQTHIWKHFLRAEDGQSVECKYCKKILKTPGGATGALHTHLRAKHSNKVSQNEDIQTPSTSSSKPNQIHDQDTVEKIPTKKMKLTDFFSSDSSMEVRVTRMAAIDGIPLSKFCTSKDLRYVFKKAGYELPKSPSTITKLVHEQTVATKNIIKNKLKEIESKNKRFAITLDEWTSTRNRRYMNINIHSTHLQPATYINLGLVRIKGSMTAQVGLELLRQHLIEFDLNLEDVISLTTDGASVMVKMGKLFGGLHQLCLAHGIQLAVFHVIYKASTATPAIYYDDSDTDDEGVEENNDGVFVEVPKISEPDIMYKDAIHKLRSLVKTFKKSPMKNDLLQKYSAEEFGRSLDLILDCKTRWNSLHDMIERFLKLKSCVMKTSLDLKLKINFTEEDIQQLENICCSLNVIKATVMALCRRDTNLLTADTAINFMLQKLDSQPNELSKKLADSLRQKIKERRTVVSSVLQYLHNNEGFFTAAETETFNKPSADEIRTFITSLLERLKFTTSEPIFRPEFQALTNPNSKSTDENTCGEKDATIASQLHEEMKKTMTQVEKPAINTDLDSIVRVEMCIYDSAGGGRGVFLTAAYNYLMQITPTSVEAERAFSSAGYLCNKVRSSLSDATLHCLLFMRSFFQSEK